MKNTTIKSSAKFCECGCGQQIETPKYPSEQRRFLKGHNARRGPLPTPPNQSGLCLCGCGQPTQPATKTNSKDGNIKGYPARYIKGHNARRVLGDRFWAKVDRHSGDGCWLWRGATSRGGYGEISHNGRPQPAHRVAWELTNGPIPTGMQVLHRCDVRACCRPDHLFLGSQRDNVNDMIMKGRDAQNPVFGERHGKSKLTAPKVSEIRSLYASGVSQQEIADRFGITRGNVGFIVSHKTWRHVK